MIAEQLMFIQNQIAGLVFAGFGLSASVFSGKSPVIFLQSFLPCQPIKSNHLSFDFDLFSLQFVFLFLFFWLIQSPIDKNDQATSWCLTCRATKSPYQPIKFGTFCLICSLFNLFSISFFLVD